MILRSYHHHHQPSIFSRILPHQPTYYTLPNPLTNLLTSLQYIQKSVKNTTLVSEGRRMETKLITPYALHLPSDTGPAYRKNQPEQQEESGMSSSSSLNLRNLSKVILPPLGVSASNQNQIESKGWIISPMDSRYRYVIYINSTKSFFFNYL